MRWRMRGRIAGLRESSNVVCRSAGAQEMMADVEAVDGAGGVREIGGFCGKDEGGI